MKVPCIGLASGIGAGNKGCGRGPHFFQRNLGLNHLSWGNLIEPKSIIDDKYNHLAALNQQLANDSFQLTKDHPFFFSFGGDHSSAIGTWSGIAEAKRPQGDIGLIWIDAHMDSHTPETSPSGNIHGMPLAVLLGHGDKRLTGITSPTPKLKPENVVLIGIRCFEAGEAELLKKLNVRVYFMEEVQRRGLVPILEEVVADLSTRTVGYGVSFDLDAIDPSVVNAVGTPVIGGFSAEESLASMRFFARRMPVAFELVEYNPELDRDLSTLQFSRELLNTLLNGGVSTAALHRMVEFGNPLRSIA